MSQFEISSQKEVQVQLKHAAEGQLNGAQILQEMGGGNFGEHGAGGKKHGEASISKQMPENACVEDKDGYIVCGPIVGYERPEAPKLNLKKFFEQK